MLYLYPKKISCSGKQNLLAQINMAFADTLQECIEKPASDAIIGIRMYPHFPGYLICRLKSNSGNVICHLIGIFFNHAINSISIPLIDFCCKGSRNAIFLKKYHCFTHILLFFYLHGNFPCLALADSFNLCQPLRLFFNNPKSIFFKFSHNPPCKRCS